jgi:hypothetical protein
MQHTRKELLAIGNFTLDEWRVAYGWAAGAGWSAELDFVPGTGAERLWLAPNRDRQGAVLTVLPLGRGGFLVQRAGGTEGAVYAALRDALAALMPARRDDATADVALGGGGRRLPAHGVRVMATVC